MPLRLHVAAHHAKAHHRLPALSEERGNDGVKWPLARTHKIGRTGLEIEAMAAVLQAHPICRLHAARTEAHVIALDEAHHHAAFIRRCEVDRAPLAVRVTRRTCLKRLCTLRVNQAGTLRQVLGVQHVSRRDPHRPGVGHVLVHIGKRKFHGFNLQMLNLRAVHRHARHVQPVQEPQRNQCGNTLAIGWNFMQRETTVTLAHRGDPIGLMRSQVRQGKCTTALRGKAHQRFANLTLVKRRALAARNGTQRTGSRLKLEQLSHFWRSAPR